MFWGKNMIKRIIEISNQSYCFKKHNQLVVEQDKKIIASIPIEDIACLIIDNQFSVLTSSLINETQKNNIALIFCDERHLPYSLLLPLTDANTLHSKVIAMQVAVSQPRKKSLWRHVVKTKIKYQLNHLNVRNIDSQRMRRLYETVTSGDRSNHEAQAAKIYWTLLFGEKFRRNADELGVNSMLNYGYAIIRAMVARAIVASGLHSAFGIHHHNQYNGLNLADDLMEPFRPWVDEIIFNLNERGVNQIDSESKREILALPYKTVNWRGQSTPLMVCCHEYISQFKKALLDNKVDMQFPKLI